MLSAMNRLAVRAALLAFGFAIFASWMHLAVLDPRNVGWLLDGEDRGLSAIGLAAYLRAGHWPSLHEPLLVYPEGLTLLFTDSIPLLGLLLGPFARLLPGQSQYIGLWYLSCVLLQVAFAWALVRRHAPDDVSALLGTALLALMPALLNRYGHASLCAQWLILWALWIYTDPDRWRRSLWWAAVLGVAALVHSYLLLMVAAIWGSSVLRRLVIDRKRWRTLAEAAGILLLVVGIAAWHGALGHGFQSTGTYGAFPMALDAFWNPANPGYSALLPSSPEGHVRGFEGLQYLGAGLLAGAVIVLAMAIRARSVPAAWRPLVWLAPAYLVILVLAIGPQWIWRGDVLATIRLPQGWIDALDPVRAGGRLAWPVTYTIAWAVIVALFRLPRASIVLAAVLAVQMVDLAPMLAATRGASREADDARVYRRLTDPRWPALIAGASSIEFEPPEPFRDLQLMEEVMWRAVGACRPVRYSYAARIERRTQLRIDADSTAYGLGQIDPTRLYVLLGDPPPIGLAGQVQRIDGIAIIAPTVAAPPPMCPSSSPRSAS